MIPSIIVVSIIVVVVVALLFSMRPRVVSVTDGRKDGAGDDYECVICKSNQVEVSDFHERCLACGYSSAETYGGKCAERINLLRDVNAAMVHLDTATIQLGGSDSNETTYAAELTEGLSLISGGAPVVYALAELHEAELADQLKALIRQEEGFLFRAERFLSLLRPAREALSKDIQRRLRAP